MNTELLAFYIVDGLLDKLSKYYDFEMPEDEVQGFVESFAELLKINVNGAGLVSVFLEDIWQYFELKVSDDDEKVLVDYVQEILDNQYDL